MNQKPEPEGRRMNVQRAAIFVGWMLTLGALVWTVADDRSTAASDIRFNRQYVTDHESRIRSLEETIRDIAGDVRWMRQAMEQRTPR